MQEKAPHYPLNSPLQQNTWLHDSMASVSSTRLDSSLRPSVSLLDHLLCGSRQLGLHSAIPPPFRKDTLENLAPSKGQGARGGVALLTL